MIAPLINGRVGEECGLEKQGCTIEPENNPKKMGWSDNHCGTGLQKFVEK